MEIIYQHILQNYETSDHIYLKYLENYVLFLSELSSKSINA